MTDPQRPFDADILRLGMNPDTLLAINYTQLLRNAVTNGEIAFPVESLNDLAPILPGDASDWSKLDSRIPSGLFPVTDEADFFAKLRFFITIAHRFVDPGDVMYKIGMN